MEGQFTSGAALQIAGQESRVRAPTQLEWIGSNSVTSDGTSYDFGNFVIPRDGVVIVAVGGVITATGSEVTGITVGGNATTNIFTATAAANPVAFRRIALPAGTYNVSATFDNSQNRAACGVWLLRNSPSNGAPVDTDGVQTTAASNAATIDVVANGFAAYMLINRNTSDPSWSGASERSSLSVEATTRMTFADKATPTTASNDVETASWTGSVSTRIVGVSWR